MKNNVAVVLAVYQPNISSFIDQVRSIIRSGINVNKLSLIISFDLPSDFEPIVSVFEKIVIDDQIETIYVSNIRANGRSANNFIAGCVCVPADCDYIFFSDQDDLWLEKKIDRSITALEKTGAGACSSDVIALFEKSGYLQLVCPKGRREHQYIFDSGGVGCSFCITSEIFLECLQYIEARDLWSHDLYFHFVVNSLGYKWEYLDNISLFYRIHGNNETGIRNGVSGFFSRVRVLPEFIRGVYTNLSCLPISVRVRQIDLMIRKPHLCYHSPFVSVFLALALIVYGSFKGWDSG